VFFHYPEVRKVQITLDVYSAGHHCDIESQHEVEYKKNTEKKLRNGKSGKSTVSKAKQNDGGISSAKNNKNREGK